MNIINKMMQSSFQSSKARPKLFKQISALMANNWQLKEIFPYMIERIEKKKDIMMLTNPIYHFLVHANDMVNQAKTLPEIFEGWVSPTELVIIKTGETTGKYAEAFEQCILLASDKAKIIKTLKGAMITPAIAVAILIGVLVGARTTMMPMLTELVDISKWSELSVSFYNLTEAVGGNPSRTLLVIGATIAFFSWATPNLRIPGQPAFRNKLDNFMPFSIYKAMQMSIFLKSLGGLLRAGVRFKDALDLIHNTSNNYMKIPLSIMIERFTSATDDDSTVFEGDFLGDYGDDLSALAKGGNIEEALEDVANECMLDVTESLPAKLKLISTLLMISIIGVVIYGLLAFYDVIGILQSGDI